jgi:hypothetical protein
MINPGSCVNVRFITTALIGLIVLQGGPHSFATEPASVAAPRSLKPDADIPPGANELKAESILDGPHLNQQPSWSEILRATVLTAIPHHYEDRRHWGKTREMTVGVKVHQRGLQFRMSEQKRKVNHGLWHRYKVELLDPANATKLRIGQIQSVDTSRFRFQIQFNSKMRCRGDFEQWLLGVKGLNLTVVSDADVQVVADCELTLRPQPNRKSLLPDLILDPKVNRVSISLRDLDVKRIGEIRGDLAESIGDISRRDIENLLQGQEQRVVKKLNEAIDKNRSHLRIPASRLW